MSRPSLMRHIGLSSGEAQNMRVETEILEPRAFSQNVNGGQVSFDLPKKGLLDQDAHLNLQMYSATAGAAGVNGLPLMAGILGCVQTASLYYNNILLQQTQEVAALMQLKSTFVEQDIRDQSYQNKIGAFSGLMVDTDSGGTAGTSVGRYSLNASNSGKGIVGLKIDGAAPECIEKEGAFKIHNTTTAANPLATNAAGIFSVPLKWIFPLFSQIQIPLALLEGTVRVVFDFSPDLNGNRAIAYSNAASPPVIQNWVQDNTIVESTCKLSIDLVYFDDEPGKPSPMEALAAQVMKGIQLVYTDYTFVESQIPAAAGAPAAPENVDASVLCGLDHQVVRNLLVAIPRAPDYTEVNQTGPSNALLGNYESNASQGQTTMQVVINNQNVYPNAINMDAKIFNEVSQVFNTPQKAIKGLTSNVGCVAGAALAFETQQMSFPSNKYMNGLGENNLQGSCQYLGCNLSRTHANVLGAGTSIGKSPVELRLTTQHTQENYGAKRILIWAEAERMMVIKGGQIMVSGS